MKTIALLFPLVLAGCARQEMPEAVDTKPVFSAAEVRLIREGDVSEPLDVVKNASAPGDKFLRTRSRPVDGRDPLVDRLIRRMKVTVRAQKGVGIAAPQVGIHGRVIVVQRLDRKPEEPFVAYLNPEITERSRASVVGREGCLSIPAGYGKVRRARGIVLAHDGPDGRRLSEKVEGFTARIFQHEIDHLDGVLFIDRMEPEPLISETAYRKMRAREKEAAGKK